MKELRKEKNLRQEDIAVELNIALMTYYRYEQGKREPTASVLCRMADYYEVTVDYLLGRSAVRNWGEPPILTAAPAQTQQELDRCLNLRHAVFCVERGVSPSIERDGWDTLSPDVTHFLIQEEGADIGALRCRYVDGAAVIQRFCVLKERRKSGLGRAALYAVEAYCRARGIRRMELDSKFEAAGFYAKCGYAAVSEPFEEAGIPHVKMTKELF